MFAPESGAVQVPDDANETPLTAPRIERLFAALSQRLTENPNYRLPGNIPFQTIIVVHGGAVFVKLIKSRETTFDIDWLAGYTDMMLEDRGLEDPVVLVSEEISAVGVDQGLKEAWMNFGGDTVIGQIGLDNVETEEIEVFSLIGTQSVQQNVVLYEDAGLKAYVMDWCWMFSRKLDRFNEQDKKDIDALLAYIEHPAILSAQRGDVKDTARELWTWIEERCPLQIADWQVRNFEGTIRDRIFQFANTLSITD